MSITPSDDPGEQIERLERSVQELTNRLDRAERRARTRLYFLGGLALVGLLSYLTGEAHKVASPRVVKAELFQLQDGEGVVRGELRMWKQGPMFALYDRVGKNLLHIEASSDGSTGMWISDPSGKVRLGIGRDDEGDVALTVRDPRGRERITVCDDKNDNAALKVYDDESTRSETPRVVVGCAKNWGAGLAVFDANGRDRIVVSKDRNGDAGLKVYDGNGNASVKLPGSGSPAPNPKGE